MKKSSEIQNQINSLNELKERTELIENIIKSISSDNDVEIICDAEVLKQDLILKIPTANKEWAIDVFKVAISICEKIDSAYIYGGLTKESGNVTICNVF